MDFFILRRKLKSIMPQSTACPRCHRTVDCQMDAIELCACSGIKLQAETSKYLSNTQYSCLCNTCLLELDKCIADIQQQQDDKLLEHRDYYMENGFMVFTERFHIRRGHCCKSGCRHCAYGYIKE